MRVRTPGEVAQLEIDFNTQDPKLAETLKLIGSYADGTEERLELEAGLYTWLAAKCQRDLGKLREMNRQAQRESERGRKAVAARGQAK